jgi:phage terminase small subunit
MAKRGSENPQTTEVIPFGVDRRLRPPDSLGDAARRVFVELTGTLPTTHFKPSDVTLLARYCEAAAMAERAAFELDRETVTADGKVSAWLGVYTAAVKVQGTLAPRLRLGPMARAKVQSKKAAAPMSVYDQMRLEGYKLP